MSRAGSPICLNVNRPGMTTSKSLPYYHVSGGRAEGGFARALDTDLALTGAV
jgi:hypothetical protein